MTALWQRLAYVPSSKQPITNWLCESQNRQRQEKISRAHSCLANELQQDAVIAQNEAVLGALRAREELDAVQVACHIVCGLVALPGGTPVCGLEQAAAAAACIRHVVIQESGRCA